ncbi:Os03g0339250 [Oryza sativa Japonica Group]|uniref:Os03g0339250 protein n=1 Tax=Oryza sativa subsp. japonica TaxID=39947 RepID=C7J0B1_ORYSJ|nr:Os03g0339250 [Oryza sativa Japonica Group]|eukprot:NP_001173410.1 Os03g0339250 [Oryza sativa Japonica Group]
MAAIASDDEAAEADRCGTIVRLPREGFRCRHRHPSPPHAHTHHDLPPVPPPSLPLPLW